MKKQHWKRNWIGERLNKESRYLKTLGDFNNSSNRELTVLNSLDNDPTEVNFLGLQVDTLQDEGWNTLRYLQPQFTSIQPRARWHGQKTKSLFISFFTLTLTQIWVDLSSLKTNYKRQNIVHEPSPQNWPAAIVLGLRLWWHCLGCLVSDLIVTCLQFAETCTF